MSDTTLCAQLKQKGVTDVYTCGIAYDVCVGEELDIAKRENKRNSIKKFLPFSPFPNTGATATDALSAGYRTILIDDCCRGVDLQDIEATKESVLNSHGVIVHSKEVKLRDQTYFASVSYDCLLSMSIDTVHWWAFFLTTSTERTGVHDIKRSFTFVAFL